MPPNISKDPANSRFVERIRLSETSLSATPTESIAINPKYHGNSRQPDGNQTVSILLGSLRTLAIAPPTYH